MKKLLKAILIGSMIISLGGCKKEAPKKENTIQQEEKQEQEKTEEKENEVIQEKEETKVEEEKKEEPVRQDDQKKEENKQEVKPVEEKKEETKPAPSTPTPAPAPQPTPTPSPTPAPSPTVTGQGVTIGQAARCVVIDAGHGGPDPGCSNGSLLEKNITLTYALAVGNYLSSKGVNVVYTRTGDYELARSSYTYNGSTLTNDLTARAAIPYSCNAALYCSIHIDSASPSAHGFSCFYNPRYADSLDAANIMLAHLASVGYTNNRGLLDGTRLRSIRGNSTISIMVELGFIQSSDIDYINNNVSTLSAAIGDAIIEKLNKGWSQAGVTVQPDLS